ncbi:MAG: AAA family ATPase [Mariprofundaceae bacterium]|nr:AAA family ATPase [Mariprofundaceae bacterium]
MYQQYFHLKGSPFSISPDPHYLYMSERHREALAHLHYTLQSDGGITLLTGEVGTGKTTVCRCFLEQLPENCELAFVVHPKLTVEELLATICDEFGISYQHHGMKHLIDQLHCYLLEAHSQNRRAILLIDEAQNLSAEVLEQLRLLTNLETNQKKLLQIILLGQPELQNMLAKQELRQFSQRIIARYHLTALKKNEVKAYVMHRLNIAGVIQNLFSAKSLKLAYQHSQGIPRLINLFCDRALLGAYAQHQAQVSEKTMRKAIHEIIGEQDNKPTSSHRRTNLWFILFLCCLALSYQMQISLTNQTQAPIVITTQAPVPIKIVEEEKKKEVQHLSSAHPNNGQAAFQTMLQYWDVDKVFKKPACQYISDYGLNCLTGKGNWQRLRQLNRPVVLHLLDENQHSFDITLVSLENKQAKIILDSQIKIVSTDLIDQYWYGDYLLLWRSLKYIRPSVEHEKFLRILQRVQKKAEPEDIASIKQFQLKQGLEADGVIGQQTLIHLYISIDTHAPKLIQEAP